jgi:hypothetical protein
MTEEPSIPQEPDAIPLRRLLWTAAIALVVGGIGLFAAQQLLHHARRGASAHYVHPALLEHASIAQTERGIELQTMQKKWLSSYGWVDRKTGLAHIPIERAIELRAEGKR